MFLKKTILICLIVFQIALLHNGPFARAQIDDLPDDIDDGEVDVEEGIPDEGAVVGKDDIDLDEDDSEEKPLKASSDADTTFIFTQPSGLGLSLPAGKDVQFLVGFANRGSKDFVVETMDASFRYPLDFSFHIQNFSALAYNRIVKPKQEVSLYYAFYTSETFSSRPFGLTVNLLYKDADGNQFLDAVFNETINIVEIDESLDGETFFLYIFLIACVVLLIVAAQQFLVSFTRRKLASGQKIEMGTQNHQNDVDYDWLPKEIAKNELNKSPRRSARLSPRKSPKQTSAKSAQLSPKQASPRERRAKRNAGAKND